MSLTPEDLTLFDNIATAAVTASQTGDVLVLTIGASLWLSEHSDGWVPAFTRAALAAGFTDEEIPGLSVHMAIDLGDGLLATMGADGNARIVIDPGHHEADDQAA